MKPTGKQLPIQKSGISLNDRHTVDMVWGTLRMLGDRILVRVEDLSLSSIIVANWTGKAVRGTVVEVGPGEYPNKYNHDRSKVWKSKTFRPTEVRPGDVVELGGLDLGGYAFPQLMLNGIKHLIASEKDVCGYYRPGEAEPV